MATTKQKRVAKLIIENATLDKPLNGGQMLAKVGYAKSMHKAKVNDVLESEGVLETLNEYGFTEDNAKMVVSEILLDPKQKGDTRINAAKEVFKVRGSYAPDKPSVNILMPVLVKFLDKNEGTNKTDNNRDTNRISETL